MAGQPPLEQQSIKDEAIFVVMHNQASHRKQGIAFKEMGRGVPCTP